MPPEVPAYRILHLASNPRWTGVAEPATSVARFQREAGCTVWVATIWGRSFEQRLKEFGFELPRELNLRRLLSPFGILRQIRQLRQFIEDRRIDVVHSHLIHDHWLAALAIRGIRRKGRSGGMPILIRTVHRLEPMRRDPWHRWLFEQLTERVITVSGEQRELIAQAYRGLAARGGIEVIGGGVDPERYRPDHPDAAVVRADMGDRQDTPIAGIVAHLGYNRGHKWLLNAAPRVLEAVPDAVIWIVGQGEIKRWLQVELRKPEYRGGVVRAGYRTSDLPATYSAMDVGMLLALGSEGTGRAALETMASGRPVIAVRRGALLETVTDGVDGVLVDPDDVEGLATALIRLLRDRALARQMGQAARQKVLEQFTEQKRADRTMEVYRRVFDGRAVTNAKN